MTTTTVYPQPTLDTFFDNYVSLIERHARPCPTCGRMMLLTCESHENAMAELVRAYADRWQSLVKHCEHVQLPAAIQSAYGTLDDVDCYRIAGYAIPASRLVEVLRAIEAVEEFQREAAI